MLDPDPAAVDPTLHLVPRHLRKEFNKMLDVEIEGDLCPVCRYRLKEEYQGRWEEITEEVFNKLFKDSPIKRTKYKGLKRNVAFVKKNPA